MKSSTYWQKRSEQIAIRQHKKTDQYNANLKREYERAMQTIQQDIEVFYQRFANNNGIVDMAEARKLLTAGELKAFKMTLEEFTALAKDNQDGRWTKVLNNVYYKTRVSRYEALQIQINQQIEMLTELQHRGTEALLGDIYKDTYYRTLFEIQRGTRIGATFAKLDNLGLRKVLGTEFAGSNWSKRIWGDRDKLSSEIYTRLSQSFIRGDSVDRTTRILAERMGVSYSSASRLVRTESAFFTEQATMDGYKASGVVQRYEVLATLDSRTSSICRGMDGMIFKLSEMEVGVNYPPFHVNCRTTTMPYFGEDEDPGERIAKDSRGKTVYVPGDMKYQEWYNKYIKSQELPKVIPTSDSFMPKALIASRIENIWIPKDAVINRVHIIAGNGVSTRLRAADTLAKKYGGDSQDWVKLAGKVVSDKYEFDVHWYQLDGKTYEHKIKTYKRRER